ncbi:PREDICTED: fractalkine-like [Pterocles gutturalis]|nr:PREDICTED: fractalkine-like [Pterocles gutturalis]
MRAGSLQVLFVLGVLCLLTLAGGQPKAPLKCSTECRGFTSGLAAKRIRSYRRTEPHCTKQAVIFITLKSMEICADPEAEWVKKIIEKLDQKTAAASSRPHDVASAAVPGEPAAFQKQVGLAVASSQPTPYPAALVHSSDSPAGSTEAPAGHTANAAAGVRGRTSPSSDSDPAATTEGSDHPVLSTNESLDPTSARTNTPDTASRSFSPDLPSVLETTAVPATPIPPETAPVSALTSTTAADKGPSAHTNKVANSSADACSTRTSGYSSPTGKPEPSETFVFTSQAFSGQARVQVTTERPNDRPLPSFLSTPPMHFVIPVSVVGGLVACSVAAVWLYLKFGLKTEKMSREMVQGLLYQKQGHHTDVCPMEVI